MPETLTIDTTGVILAGGKSQRMGQDKAFLTIEGKPLLERTIHLLHRFFPRVIICGDHPERFAAYDIEVFPDINPGSPLGGIHSAIVHTDTPYVFISACDIPCPSSIFIRHALSLRNDYDVVLARHNMGAEPLFALYSARCLPAIEAIMDAGNFRIYDFFPEVRVKYVEADELTALGISPNAFTNLNTPEEVAQLEKVACL